MALRSCTCLAFHIYLTFQLLSLYRALIWLPSIVSPMLAMSLERYLPVSWWVLWVTCNELLLSIRLFEEGTVAFAFKTKLLIDD